MNLESRAEYTEGRIPPKQFPKARIPPKMLSFKVREAIKQSYMNMIASEDAVARQESIREIEKSELKFNALIAAIPVSLVALHYALVTGYASNLIDRAKELIDLY